MPVIKSPNFSPTATHFSISDIEERAQLLVARARAEADRVLAEAKATAERLKADAKKTGHAEGRAAGVVEGKKLGLAEGKAAAMKEQQASLASLVSTLNATLAEIDKQRQTIESEARSELLLLSLAIARKVCHRLGRTDPNVVEANVTQAIAMAQAKSKVRVSIHPSQRDLIEQLLPQLKLKWSTLQQVELTPDESVKPGGCRVQAGAGEIDADLDTQLDRIAAELVPEKATATPFEPQRLWPEDMID